MKKKLNIFLIFFLLVTTNLLAKHYHISKNVANLHIVPKQVSEVGSQAIYGTSIKILKEQDEWYFVQTPDKYKGWVLKDFVIAREDEYLKKGIKARVKSLWAHIQYVKDTTPYPPIITLPFETEIEILSPKEEFSNRWVKVRLIDGEEGYAQTRDLNFDPKVLSINEMVEFSKFFLNIPYYWGGNSSFGYDCSGFTQMLYRQMGIDIPRDSKDQVSDPRFEKVKFKDLQKGDLVFFTGNGVSISHVGIYLENGEVIHSDTVNIQPKIQITKIILYKIDHHISTEDFVTARRLKKNSSIVR